MKDDPDKKREPVPPASDPLAHLLLRDTRTPTEREEAERQERARRKGRGRKDWWKDCAPDK